MVALKSLAAAVLVAQGALASPAQDPQLAKRGEGIHLLNCRPWGGAGVAQTWLSLVVVRSHLHVLPQTNSVCEFGLMISPIALVLRQRLGLQQPELQPLVRQRLRQGDLHHVRGLPRLGGRQPVVHLPLGRQVHLEHPVQRPVAGQLLARWVCSPGFDSESVRC